MIQILLEYSRDFTDEDVKKRLCLIVPQDFEVPAEIQDVVAMLDFDTPVREELRPIYEDVIEALPPEKQPKYSEADIDRILSLGAGMTAMEFENAVSRGFVTHRAKLPKLDITILCGVLGEVKTEVVKRSEVLELMPPVKMDQVGGLDDLKDWIRDLKGAFSKEAREAGVDNPKGCALVGPLKC